MSKVLKKQIAILKGHLSIDDALSWPTEPEKAAEQHCDFLGQWLLLGKVKKPDVRKACKEAWPQLTAQSLKKLTDGLQDVRTAMKRKWKNMKTGGRTPKELQEMLEHVFGDGPKPGKASLPKSEPAKASKSVKRDALEPVKARGILPTKSESREEVEPAKAVAHEALIIQKVRVQSSEEEACEGSEAAPMAIDAITVSSVVSVSCSELEKAKETKKKKGFKKPSKAVPKKKPALAGNSSGLQVAKVHNWLESQTFGWMKVTYASQKGYIVTKLEKADKPTLLVNVGVPKGDKQSLILKKLLEKAAQAGQTKEKIVEYKNSLL